MLEKYIDFDLSSLYAIIRRRIKIRSNNVNDELFLRYKPNLRGKKKNAEERRQEYPK